MPKLLPAVFVAMAACVSTAQAAPYVYTFTGTIDASYSISGSGDYAGLFGVGDDYTLTTTINGGAPPDDNFETAGSHVHHWYSGVSMSLSLGGHTFTVTDSATVQRTAFDSQTSPDFVYVSGNGGTFNGSTTSTLASVDFLVLDWTLNAAPGTDLLGAEPEFPAFIDLADWVHHDMYFEFEGADPGSVLVLSTNGGQNFSNAVIPAPTPGAALLLGVGLMGVAVTQRKHNAARRQRLI